jgi:hypothetical protein
MIHPLVNDPENRKENISPHFQLWEVDCQSGKLVPDTYLNNAITLAKDLEVIRSEFNLPITRDQLVSHSRIQ